MGDRSSSTVDMSGLASLVVVAAHHGVSTSVERLSADHALAGACSMASLARIAGALGLKARAASLAFDRLPGLGAVFPLLARLADGSVVVVAGVGQGAAAILAPASGRAGIEQVALADLAARWSGEVLFLKRDWRLGDSQQPFGLGYFIAEALRHKRSFVDIAVAAVTLQAIGLLFPFYFQLVIDKVLVHHSVSTLAALTAGVLIVVVFDAVFGYLRQYISMTVTRRLDMRLSSKVFSHLLSLPITFFEEGSTGVTARHMQQVERIRQFLTGRLFMTVLDAVGLLVFLPILFFYSAPLAGIVLAFALAIALVVVVSMGPFRRRLQELYNAEAERQAMLVESIGGMRAIKSLAMEPVQRRQWDRRAATVVDMHFTVGRMTLGVKTVTGMLEKTLMVVVIAVGAQLVFDHALSIGALVAFNMLATRVVYPLVQIAALVQEYQEAALSVRMLSTIMRRAPERVRPSDGLRPALKGRIELSGVTFRYGPSLLPAMDNVTLTIPVGVIIGVVGRSGSGKSTLTKLLQGLYAPQGGVIRLDGIDIREIDLAHLRRSLGVVLQDSFLFHGSIRDNIAAAAPGASIEEIAAAARLAGADEFVETLPQGYDTMLEEGAANLSGGQKQRLSIARALLVQPRILILDEATSALDPDSEAVFMDNLARIAAGRTVIMVSHRLSTLAGANAIVVLDRGRIVDVGPHGDLLGRCDIYTRLWQQQNRHL